MLRSQVLGRVAWGLSSLHSKGLLNPQTRGLQLLANSGLKWGPSKLSGNSHRFCSILGSPACGGSPSSPSHGLFHEVLEAFPKNRSLVFAYGSGVFQQSGQQTKDNMTDFIFCVEDSEEWHKENLARHPSHYASLARFLGPQRITAIQRFYGAKLYFNTLVPWGEGKIKYGVIDRKDLLLDLMDWQTLYTAGRLHKPVNILDKHEEDKELDEALRSNLNSALHAALLLLPGRFSEEQLYLTLAGLSYTGDFRMVVGEDKNKVANIVRPQIERFRQLYKSRVADSKEFLQINSGQCEQDCGHRAKLHHLELLPLAVAESLVIEWCNKHGKTRDLETVCYSLAGDPDCDHKVIKAVANLVASTDKSQAAKGVLTAGPRKAVKYAGAKLKKMMKSQLKS